MQSNRKLKVIVHIGTEKTGTTSLQQFFHLNRDCLMSYGFAYLKSPGLRKHRDLATYCINDESVDDHILDLGIVDKSLRDIWRDEVRNQLYQEWEQLPQNIHTVVISSEHFHSRLVHEKEINSFSKLVTPLSCSCKIIVYLRRQDLLALSLASTLYRGGEAIKDILSRELTNTDKEHYYNYYFFLEKWSQIFGFENLFVRVFEKEKLLQHDLINDFMVNTAIDINRDELIFPKRQNQSLSRLTQEILIRFNRTFPPNYLNNKVNVEPGYLREKLIEVLEMKYYGSPKMPTRRNAMNFYSQFLNSNRSLSQKYFAIDDCFSQDFSMYPEKEEEIELELDTLDDIFDVFSSVFEKDLLVSRTNLRYLEECTDSNTLLEKLSSIFQEKAPNVSRLLKQIK